MNRGIIKIIGVLMIMIIVGIAIFFILNKKQYILEQTPSTKPISPNLTSTSENSSSPTVQPNESSTWKTYEIPDLSISYKLPPGLKPYKLEKGAGDICSPYFSFAADYSDPKNLFDLQQIPYVGIIGFETGSSCNDFDFDRLVANGEIEPFVAVVPAWRTKDDSDVRDHYFRYQDKDFRLGLLWPTPEGEDLTSDGIDKMNKFFESVAKTVQPK